MDVGEQMEVVVSMVSGKKPGAFITLIGVATVHITFKVKLFYIENMFWPLTCFGYLSIIQIV